MEGRMGRRGGRPHPQHQNKTGECLERSQSKTDNVPRPNGSGGEASSDSATAFVFGGESAPKARAMSCEFFFLFFFFKYTGVTDLARGQSSIYYTHSNR